VDGRPEGGTNSPNLGSLSSQRVISGLKVVDTADWYKFSMPGTGTSANFVKIDFTHSQGDLDLYVYRSDGTTVVGSSTGTGNTEQVSLSGQPAGTYYVKVYGYNGAQNPSYTLTINPGVPESVISNSWTQLAASFMPDLLAIPLEAHDAPYSAVQNQMSSAIANALSQLPGSIDVASELTLSVEVEGEVSAGLPGFSLQLAGIATGYNFTYDVSADEWTISRVSELSLLTGSVVASQYVKLDTLNNPTQLTPGFAVTAALSSSLALQAGEVLQAEVSAGTETSVTISAETTLQTQDFLQNYVHQPDLVQGLADVFIPYYGDSWWETLVDYATSTFSPVIPIGVLVDISRTDTVIGILAHAPEVTVSVAGGHHLEGGASLGLGGEVPILPAINAGASVSVGVTISVGVDVDPIWTRTFSGWEPVDPADGATASALLQLSLLNRPAPQSVRFASTNPLAEVQSSPPEISSFSSIPPSPIIVGQVVTLTATATDPDTGDSVTKVSFYEDLNGNGTAETNELLSVDGDGSDGWGANWDTKLHTPGQATLLAVAEDTSKASSAPKPLVITLAPPPVNHVPTVNTFQATPPSPITVGQVVTLTATATDPDTGDSVTKVSFYEDLNGNGTAETNELLSVDGDGSDGWNSEWNTGLHVPGLTTILTLAYDSSYTAGTPRVLQLLLTRTCDLDASSKIDFGDLSYFAPHSGASSGGAQY